MWLEATGKAFTYRWPGGEVHLEQGKPVDLPDARAKRLLSKAQGKVRAVIPILHPGDTITWQREGTVQHGLVDFIHNETDGTRWAFVTLADNTWAAVNLIVLPLSSASHSSQEGRRDEA